MDSHVVATVYGAERDAFVKALRAACDDADCLLLTGSAEFTDPTGARCFSVFLHGTLDVEPREGHTQLRQRAPLAAFARECVAAFGSPLIVLIRD